MAKFLDKAGLERLTEHLDVKLFAKQDKLTGAPGQVVGFGEDGNPAPQSADSLVGPPGPTGPDGNPIGTVISFMGTNAPKDYLICDGAVYNVADYADLAEFFDEQFGSANYFGGDGETTFAVPDMRNLFLRGFCGDADEQLSGMVGQKQEGTVSNSVLAAKGNSGKGSIVAINNDPAISGTQVYPYNIDSIVTSGLKGIVVRATENPDTSTPSAFSIPETYTSRPVNMAVLYCIKAVASKCSENFPTSDVYSTKETRIGTWIDGKPLYRKVLNTTTGVVKQWSEIQLSPNVDIVVNIYGFFVRASDPKIVMVPHSSIAFGVDADSGTIFSYTENSSNAQREATLVIEYTKPTDQATIPISAAALFHQETLDEIREAGLDETLLEQQPTD